MIKHSQIREMLAIYRDLSSTERAQVDAHVRECAECAARLRSFTTIQRDLRQLRLPEPSGAARRRFYQAIEGNMQKTNTNHPRAATGFIGQLASVVVLLLTIAVIWAVFQTLGNYWKLTGGATPGSRPTPVSSTPVSGIQPGGRLAYLTQLAPGRAQMRVLDLSRQQEATSDNPPLRLISWSPSGEYLLVGESVGYTVYRADGTVAGHYRAAADPFWAPLDALNGAHDWLAMQDSNGSLQAIPFPGGQSREVVSKSLSRDGLDPLLWSRDGWLAWTPNMNGLAQQVSPAQLLFVRRVDDANSAKSWKLSDDVTQAYYLPMAWAPGTRYILAARARVCNSCSAASFPLVRINADTGEITDLGVSTLLTREAYDWNPVQPGVLALVVGDSLRLYDEHRLAILDVKKAALQYLTGAGTSAFEPAWSPDGKFLAYAQAPVTPNPTGEGEALERTLQGRSIMIVNPATGTFSQLTKPGQAIDGWPHWSADGKQLLYARNHDGITEIHALMPDSGADQILVRSQPAPLCYDGGCGWSLHLQYRAIGK